jgi:hypothetical protein
VDSGRQPDSRENRCSTDFVILRTFSLGVLWLSLTGLVFLLIDLYT